jgi:hypothetical protein
MDEIIFSLYRMSEWIKHVKNVQAQHNIPYKDALKVASDTYQKVAKTARRQAKERLIGAVENKVESLLGMGATGRMLKESAAGNVVRLLDSGTDRATRAMSGSSVNRFKKANRWQTFVDTTIRDTIDTGAKGAKAYYNATSPLEQMGFGLKRHKKMSGMALMAAGY